MNILFYDGPCALCNFTVNTLVKFEKKDTSNLLNFSTLQGKTASELLDESLLVEPYSGVVLFENGQSYVGATAIKRLEKYIRKPWSWFFKFPIHKFYLFIVKIRHRFGSVSNDYCPLSTNYTNRLLP